MVFSVPLTRASQRAPDSAPLPDLLARAARRVLALPERTEAWPDMAVGRFVEELAGDPSPFICGGDLYPLLVWTTYAGRGAGVYQDDPLKAPEHEVAWLGQLLTALREEVLIDDDDQALLMLQAEDQAKTLVIEFRLHPRRPIGGALTSETREIRARRVILDAGWNEAWDEAQEPRLDDIGLATTFAAYVAAHR